MCVSIVVPSGPGALAWATEHAVHFRSLDMMGFPPNGLWTERQYTTEITSQLSTIFGVWDESTSGDASLLPLRAVSGCWMRLICYHSRYIQNIVVEGWPGRSSWRVSQPQELLVSDY